MGKIEKIKKLIRQLVDFTKEYGMNSEEAIQAFIRGEIDCLYKGDEENSSEERAKLINALTDAVVSERFGEKRTLMKIYIARDRAVFEDERQEGYVGRHPEIEHHYGRLRLFYEQPTLNPSTGIWEQARVATEIKSYMFPQIKCEECAEFHGLDNIPETNHYPGSVHTIL